MADSDALSIDYDAINRKYEEERAKRLRSDGTDQWIEIKTQAKQFDKDYYADPNFKRDPIVEDVDALVIGAGVGGLLAGGRLREAGIDNLRMVEKASDFGGVSDQRRPISTLSQHARQARRIVVQRFWSKRMQRSPERAIDRWQLGRIGETTIEQE